jgi:methyl-accepting chemotaxis protein
MKIKHKLLITLSSTFLLICSSLISQNMSVLESQKITLEFENRFKSNTVAKEFSDSSANLTRLARSYVATGDQQYKQQYWDIVKWRSGETARPESVYSGLHVGEKVALRRIMEELNFSANELALLDSASQLSNDLIKTETQSMGTIDEGAIIAGPFEALAGETVSQFAIRILFDQNYHQEVKKIQQPLQEFFKVLDGRTLQQLKDKSDSAEFWITTALYLQVLAILSLGLMIFISIKAIFKPLDRVVTAMSDLSEGEGSISSRLDASGRDELAELAGGFNAFAENIEKVVNSVNVTSHGISDSSAELSATAQRTDAAITNQKSTISQVSTAVNDLLLTIQSIASSAVDAATAATESNEQASKGLGTVDKMSSSIKQLTEEIQGASNAIRKVEQDSNTIATVLDVIRGIADQTNLLALNAAIEAARAGEQGRGFAVVADEVRSLAQRTQISTTEIQSMVESLQNSAQTAVNVMEKSQSQSVDCVELAGEAGTVISQISESIASINNMNTDISQGSVEQSNVLSEINTQILEILDQAQEISIASEQIASSSEESKMLSVNLSGIVKEFKL